MQLHRMQLPTINLLQSRNKGQTGCLGLCMCMCMRAVHMRTSHREHRIMSRNPSGAMLVCIACAPVGGAPVARAPLGHLPCLSGSGDEDAADAVAGTMLLVAQQHNAGRASQIQLKYSWELA